MAKGRIGLDIGSTAVRAVELMAGDPPTIVRAAQVPLGAGAVENGEVKEPELVTAALRELWERGGFKSRQANMGVGNQRVVVREIALPYLPEKELRASLGFQVQEFIPMSVDEAVEFAMELGPAGEIVRLAETEGERLKAQVVVALREVTSGRTASGRPRAPGSSPRATPAEARAIRLDGGGSAQYTG